MNMFSNIGISLARVILYSTVLFCSLVSCDQRPGRYCHLDTVRSPDSSKSFCISVSSYHNFTTGYPDTYFTLLVPRPNGTSLGWTAVGLGSGMDGALMFAVYGDPYSTKAPTLSVRTSSSNGQLESLHSSPFPNINIRVITATWQWPSEKSTYYPSTRIASIVFVCPHCMSWTGSKVDLSNSQQPWIWVVNEDQIFDHYGDDVALKYSPAQRNGDNAGSFPLDMRPSKPPEIDSSDLEMSENLASLSTGSGNQTTRVTLWTLHGIFLAFAFVLLFPIGATLIRFPSALAFRYHWIVQVLASILATVGGIIGLALHPRLQGGHPKLGLAVLTMIWIQILLGWRHHVSFLKLSRPTRVTKIHRLLGKVLLPCGSINVLLGMSLRGRDQLFIKIIFALLTLVLTAVMYCLSSCPPADSSDEKLTSEILPLMEEEVHDSGEICNVGESNVSPVYLEREHLAVGISKNAHHYYNGVASIS